MNKIESNLHFKNKINTYLTQHNDKINYDKINIQNLNDKIKNLEKNKNKKINNIFSKYQKQLNIIYTLLKEHNKNIKLYNSKINENHYIGLKNNHFNKKIINFKNKLKEINILIKEQYIIKNYKIHDINLIFDEKKNLNCIIENLYIQLKNNDTEKRRKLELLKIEIQKTISSNINNIQKLKQKLKAIHNNLQIKNIKQNINFIEEENIFLKNNLDFQIDEIKKYQDLNNQINININCEQENIKKIEVKKYMIL